MFTKYSSITNSYDKRYLSLVRETVPEDVAWEVTEKLHGANFSFLVSDGLIYHCSRNMVLGPDKFYNHDELSKYHEAIAMIFEDLTPSIECREDLSIQIYGEYVGPTIQKGIDYGEPDFYCFDIKVKGGYLPQDIVRELCQKHGLKTVPLIFVGPLESALQINNEYNSRILNKSVNRGSSNRVNICEGNVLKPLTLISTSTEAGY